MGQFKKILKFELKNFFTNKIFVGITLFLVVVIGIVMFIPRIVSFFETGENDPVSPSDLPVMLIQADSQPQASLVQEYFAVAFPDYQVKIAEGDLDSIQSQITEGRAECAFVMTSPVTYTYYVNNLSMYDANTEIATGVLQNVYRVNAMLDSGMTPEQAGTVMNIQITGETESLGKNQMQNFFYTYIMIFALYMVILLYGQMVATNVATEKSSRAMELLITSAKPTAMMFGKVLAACISGFVQIALIFGSAVVFFQINQSYWGDNAIIQSIFNIPIPLLVFMLVFFVLGFLIYAFLFGAIGSTASKLEDINTAVQPVTFLFVFGFMVVMFSMTGDSIDSLLMRICSFIPFTSPMAMFTRIAMSTVPWYEIAASIGILMGSTAAIGILSAKIYRVGVLMYGNPPKIGALIKSVWKA